MSYSLSRVMDRVASLMNDTAKTLYTYEAQLPYAKAALDELQEEFELNNIPVTNTTSSNIKVAIGTTEVGFNTVPALPPDLIEPSQLWEKLSGANEPFIPMVKKEFLPHYLENVIVDSLIYWVWNGQKLGFIGANTDRDVKVDYVASLFPDDVDENTVINVVNSRSFLSYRTGALCAKFIGENESRSIELNQAAIRAIDRSLGISTKGRQDIAARRRPFRASYRSRVVW